MPREDSLSSRFDYLFEPLDVEESVPDAADASSKGADDGGQTPTAAPVRMAFAAFVLATLGVVAVIAVLLLQEPNAPQSPLNLPVQPSPPPMSVANVPSQADTVAPLPPTIADDPTPRTIESIPTPQVPPSVQQPALTPAPRGPQGGVSNSPTTRAPISVAPESRPPFPNEGPPPGENGGGGLLGGLL
ncbi:hypothetical protein [Mycobacterium sp. ITM-2016-00318]|uniref:hypothetical protein n=1 Tax=Mycobacterium sp. ITM-2016-00318 TaxID=2099693 RepID=UPI000CF8CFF0|nr:hypothetical protein [Mycobacterium sp. ITM-2016-00318]WNG90843.1 hypothetical protein C6A82_014955 [Mycobacterium sp. ITM-2016-00318]